MVCGRICGKTVLIKGWWYHSWVLGLGHIRNVAELVQGKHQLSTSLHAVRPCLKSLPRLPSMMDCNPSLSSQVAFSHGVYPSNRKQTTTLPMSSWASEPDWANKQSSSMDATSRFPPWGLALIFITFGTFTLSAFFHDDSRVLGGKSVILVFYF